MDAILTRALQTLQNRITIERENIRIEGVVRQQESEFYEWREHIHESRSGSPLPVLGSYEMEQKAVALTTSLIANKQFRYRRNMLQCIMAWTPVSASGVVCIIVNYATTPDKVLMGHFASSTPLNMSVNVPFDIVHKVCRNAFLNAFQKFMVGTDKLASVGYDYVEGLIVCFQNDFMCITVGAAVESSKDDDAYRLDAQEFLEMDMEHRYSKYMDDVTKKTRELYWNDEVGAQRALYGKTLIARVDVIPFETVNTIDLISVNGLDYIVCMSESAISLEDL